MSFNLRGNLPSFGNFHAISIPLNDRGAPEGAPQSHHSRLSVTALDRVGFFPRTRRPLLHRDRNPDVEFGISRDALFHRREKFPALQRIEEYLIQARV